MKNGDKFSRWTIIDDVPLKQGSAYYVAAQCNCGKVKTVSVDNLKSGKSVSCGCLRVERITKHGLLSSPTYSTWMSMKQRCLDKNCPGYWRYGGAGITVSQDWLNFKNFVADMGECPEGMQLDRIDNNGNYCKENCRWITPRENIRNRDMTPIYKGHPMFYTEIAADMGINIVTLWKRRKSFPNLTLEELAFL